jgi:hypothetical protein
VWTVTGGTASGGMATGGVWTVTGGTASGGTATGGSATGGTTSVRFLCDTVASLPTVGTSCDTVGESQCDASGNQCVCARGIWICSTGCASTYPEPAPGSPCVRGAACNYPSGVSCDCLNSSWHCLGSSACPADTPVTGAACNGLTGTWCDYPNSNPAWHFVCACTPNTDAGSTWTCFQSADCPATQPAYGLNATCPGVAFCSYGSVHCTCSSSGRPWVCGLWVLGMFGGDPPEPGG